MYCWLGVLPRPGRGGQRGNGLGVQGTLRLAEGCMSVCLMAGWTVGWMAHWAVGQHTAASALGLAQVCCVPCSVLVGRHTLHTVALHCSRNTMSCGLGDEDGGGAHVQQSEGHKQACRVPADALACTSPAHEAHFQLTGLVFDPTRPMPFLNSPRAP